MGLDYDSLNLDSLSFDDMDLSDIQEETNYEELMFDTVQSIPMDMPDELYVNRTQLLNNAGLIVTPYDKTKNEYSSHKALYNLLICSYEAYQNYIAGISRVCAVPYDFVASRDRDENRTAIIERVLSCLLLDKDKQNSILSESKYKKNKYFTEYFSDVVRRAFSYAYTIKVLEGEDENYFVKSIDKVNNSIVGKEFIETFKINNIFEATEDELYITNKLDTAINDCKIYSFSQLFNIANKKETERGLRTINPDNILLNNLILSSITYSMLESRLKQNPFQVMDNLLTTWNDEILNNQELLDSIKATSLSLYERFIKAAYYTGSMFARWIVPTATATIFYSTNTKAIVNCLNNYMAQCTNPVKINQKVISNIAGYILPEWNVAMLEALKLMKGEYLSSTDSYLKIKELSDASRVNTAPFYTLLDTLYQNSFDLFANKIKIVYKDLTIKTYEPATECQFWNTEYFDETKYENMEQLAEKIEEIKKK